MNKIKFDSNGIYASDAKLNAIALQVLERNALSEQPAAVLLNTRP